MMVNKDATDGSQPARVATVPPTARLSTLFWLPLAFTFSLTNYQAPMSTNLYSLLTILSSLGVGVSAVLRLHAVTSG